jgi:hypothetical protein
MMSAPERNQVQVVRCKGCKRSVPISVDAPSGSVTVRCPICMERRSYIVCTEGVSWSAIVGSYADFAGETVIGSRAT